MSVCPSPTIRAGRSEPGSWQHLKLPDDSQQRLHGHVAIDNNAPAVRAHKLDPTTDRSRVLFRLLQRDHRRANPGMSASRPSRYALRQANSSGIAIPCRRAVADVSRGPEKLSSTIRCFSLSDHRRRRPVPTISRRLIRRVPFMAIHNDNQLTARQSRKAAHTEWIPFNVN